MRQQQTRNVKKIKNRKTKQNVDEKFRSQKMEEEEVEKEKTG